MTDITSSKNSSSDDVVLTSSEDVVDSEDSVDSDDSDSHSEDVYLKSSNLLRFSDTSDKVLFVFGIVGSILTGIAEPLSLFVLSKVVDSFTTASTSSLLDRTLKFIPFYVSLGSITFACAFLQMFSLTVSAKRQSRRIRLLLFKHILYQDIAWFDQQSSGNLITKLSYNVDQIEAGISDRLGTFLQSIVTFISCIVVSLVLGWKLTLVSFAMIPAVVGAFMILAVALRKIATKELLAYEKAGSIAAEILTSIRTVFAFGGQEKEAHRYEKELSASAKVFVLRSLFTGLGMGMIGLAILCTAALVVWYGIELVITENYDNGAVIAVLICFIIGNTSLGRGLPEIESFVYAKFAAKDIFSIIDRIPPINLLKEGIKLDSFSGKIEFNNVSFFYPSRPDVQVLSDFSLTVNPGETVAIVGPSGSGKSTTVQLLQRLYDTSSGSIQFDGTDIRDLDVAWLRRQLGVVSQEPNLFVGTVTENIQMGKPDAEFDEVEASAKQADAHNFIVAMPKAYETFLTEGGGKLSGGQKQRVAIARALIRKPKILILDEATSALDNKSEKVVQAAFDKASRGHTVIMIAHRLTTVRNADRIVVIDGGVIQEMGTHDELVAIGGIYADMLTKQSRHFDEEDEEDNLGYISKSDEEKSEKFQRGQYRASKFSEGSSVSSVETDKSVVAKDKKPPLLQAMAMNKPEWFYLLYGAVAIALSGLYLPAFALVYTEVFFVFFIQDPEEKRSRTSYLAGLFAAVGFLRFFLQLTGTTSLGVAGSRLTKRARRLFFNAILKQEVAWFDRPENQAGVLTARLSTEVQSLHRVTGTQLSIFLECVALLIASLVVGFYYNWALCLIALVFLPALVIASSIQTRQIMGGGQHQIKGMNAAHEAFTSNRTVAAFGLEDFVYEKFREESKTSAKHRYGQALLFALVHCLANATFYFLICAYFYYGAILVDRGEITVPIMFRVFSAIQFAAMGLGTAATFAPDFVSASQNIKKTLATINRKTKMDVNEGNFPKTPPKGEFHFKNIYFRYPTRRKICVLRKFSHTVKPGTSVAMVGPSGCGKSTLLQLVQRFYDVDDKGPDSGIFLDGQDLRSLAPSWIRQHIGIVSQEPNLFNLTIRENIEFGSTKGDSTMEEIEEAAKQANIHDFIASLPQGYDTNVGSAGSQLSGGQKQRVAIARAFLRNPTILLLDEATSALDVDNERIVQQTLDEAMLKLHGRRTSLVVAHRLSTVMNCDEVVVLIGGRRVESGPPQELLQQKGAFYDLHTVKGNGH